MPLGEKDMDGYTIRVYTKEQQDRLGVNEVGEKQAKPVQTFGPAWTHGAAVRLSHCHPLMMKATFLSTFIP